MAANDTAIEERLHSIQANLKEVKTDVRELRADNKALRDRLDEKMDALAAEDKAIREAMAQGFEKVNARIDGVNASLSGKIDSVNATQSAKIDGVNASLSEKIDVLTKGFAEMRGTLKAMFWIFGVVGSLVAIAGTVVGIGKALHWF